MDSQTKGFAIDKAYYFGDNEPCHSFSKNLQSKSNARLNIGSNARKDPSQFEGLDQSEDINRSNEHKFDRHRKYKEGNILADNSRIESESRLGNSQCASRIQKLRQIANQNREKRTLQLLEEAITLAKVDLNHEELDAISHATQMRNIAHQLLQCTKVSIPDSCESNIVLQRQITELISQVANLENRMIKS